jgi:2-polyprenyl-3-methyl-5-hydroxy-6-metoxy-1,4-benzoquinol methylase
MRKNNAMTVYCPFCKNESRLYFSVGDLNQGLTIEIFNYYRCSFCRLIFLSPIPNNLSAYYVSTYPAYQTPTVEELEAKTDQEKYKLDIVQNVIAHGRLLEIGPGYGGFAYLAKKAGFEVEAIEMDTRCCQFLTDVLKIPSIHSNDVPSVLKELRPYNVITMWHVIEHLPDPWSVLEALSKKLLPDGIIIIAAPNPDSFQFRIFGRYWVHVDAPRHLKLIPRGLLTKQLEILGLKNVLNTTKDKASIIFSTFGWWRTSFNNLLKTVFQLPRSKNENHLKSNVKVRIRSFRFLIMALYSPLRVFKKIIIVILRLIFPLIVKPIERIEGIGCAYTAIFKKTKP